MHLLNHLLVTALFSLLLLNPVRAEEVHAAVASNFTAPMKQIVEQFEKSSGHDVTLSFGSSGKLFAQIQNRAPFQVFLSADQQKPEALEKNGLTVPGTRFTYAVGSLAPMQWDPWRCGQPGPTLWTTTPG